MGAKSRNQEKDNPGILKWIPGISIVLMTILGTGGLWTNKQSGLEKSKYELDKTSKIVELRSKIEENMFKLTGLNRKYNELVIEHNIFLQNGIVERPTKGDTTWKDKYHNMVQETDNMYEYEFPTLENNIVVLESRLAILEGREPQKFKFPIRLPRPKNLRVTTIP